MKNKFESIIHHLITNECLTKINFNSQFKPAEKAPQEIARNINSAFLILLSGNKHLLYDQALDYLNTLKKQKEWGNLADFYQDGLRYIAAELEENSSKQKVKESLEQLYSWLEQEENLFNINKTIHKIWQLFFPEANFLSEDTTQAIAALRDKRKVTITTLNQAPLQNPIKEMLFTANILLTVPPQNKNWADLPLKAALKKSLEKIKEEQQCYWYDHPIQIGVPLKQNEVVYGLSGLNEAVKYEKQEGHIRNDEKLTCLLSVSVTHDGLHQIAKPYLAEELKKVNFPHLDIYIFTEQETKQIIDNLLIPAAGQYLNQPLDSLYSIFGVDGEYGRHYSFLKAISALWQVLIDPEVKATFKIDLDQVFPQKELKKETGLSVFEHFKTPLWGAKGKDSEGNHIELGMLAGALVNEKDISNSLFTPDVAIPFIKDIKGDELIFFSGLPQALSTRAEMTARYLPETSLDGKTTCIQRIHVTGGTTGILINALRRYQPFTPTFIARAEDQAYLFSVLFKNRERNLRYLHKAGLIMRHDKEAFAAEAMQAAALGNIIGEYARILWFSYYAKSLPWEVEKTKDTVDPFTGCFVSKIPITIVYLRLALKAALFFGGPREDNYRKGLEFLTMGAHRLQTIIKKLSLFSNPLMSQYQKEKDSWHLYYAILDKLEDNLSQKDPFACDLQKKAKRLIQETTV